MTSPAPPPITLLTDFGTQDYYVGALRGVLASEAPGHPILDLTHDVEPGDVEHAAFVLAATWREFPPGTVHLVVVDPGVGSARRVLAVTRDERLFVAPDNGVLDGILDGADVRTVTEATFFRPAGSTTFHGRDRFAPLAAGLARGVPPSTVGDPCADPQRLDIPRPSRRGLVAEGRVSHVDRFGNVVTDLPAEWFAPESNCRVEIQGRTVTRGVNHYAELAAGEPGWLIGSLRTLELSFRGESLAERWSVHRGSKVRVSVDPGSS